jgi:DNA-binding NtrC family response regulator
MAARILVRHGYRVVAARHGDDALLAWHELGGRVDVLLTDLRMPGMGGRALAQRLAAERPELPVVMMSGYANDADPVAGAGRGEALFLQKPFTAESLLRLVRAAIDRTRPA